MRLSVRPLPLAAALLALPIAMGVLPSAVAAPPPDKPCKPAKRCEPATEPTTDPEPTPVASRVVVADIDTGINPYHDLYYAHGPSEVTPDVLAEFPGITTIRLTHTGDFAADFAADKAVWESIELGKPYWFEGTNVIGISFDDATPTKIFADSGDEHGVGTSAAVLNANPEAIVLFVEGSGVDGESYAFTHPAVDIVTTSYGWPGSPPVPFHLEKSYEGTVKLGKLHFGAADNSPALSPPDGTSGPWWSIGVAGFHEDTSGGRELLSGNLVDIVSDFTQDLPYCSDCETGTETVSGTSFATPRSAGTASKILLEARRKAGHVGGPVVREGLDSLAVAGTLNLTPWQLRRAFEQAAAYPALADYDPESAVFDDLGTSAPVAEDAPWAQTGWGVFSPDEKYGVIGEALARLGVTGTPTREKSAEACAFNNAGIDARHLYWDNVAIGSESWLTTDGDPYIYC